MNPEPTASPIPSPRRSALVLELASGRIRPMRPVRSPASFRRAWGEDWVFEEHPACRSTAHRISLLQPVVFLALSGRTFVDWTDGASMKSCVVESGGFSLLPAHSPYTVRLRSTGTTALVSFPGSNAEPGNSAVFPWIHGAKDETVRELVFALCSFSHRPTADGAATGPALLFHLFQRFGCASVSRAPSTRDSGLPPAVLAQALRFIEDHLERPLSVADIAHAVGLSESHFARRFKASLGTSPHRHLVGRRVALGKSLLARGLSPVEAALRAGFCDQPHFCRCFREIEGTTPSRFLAHLPTGVRQEAFPA